jgi:hypothetical protein
VANLLQLLTGRAVEVSFDESRIRRLHGILTVLGILTL